MYNENQPTTTKKKKNNQTSGTPNRHSALLRLYKYNDGRVNFLKYQKPEKKIDLNRSEVYKVVHHLDRQPVRGIEVRAPVVPSEADIRAAAQSS